MQYYRRKGKLKQFQVFFLLLCLGFGLAACGRKTQVGQQNDEQTAEQRAGQTAEQGAGQNARESAAEKPAEGADAADAVLHYDAFLSGQEKLFTGQYSNGLSQNMKFDAKAGETEGLSLTEFCAAIMQTADYADSGHIRLQALEQAPIDCGGDGDPELALRLSLEDDYGETTVREAIIKYVRGRLQLCYVTGSFFRYYEELRGSAGLIVSGGSSGAASYSYGLSVVDADGLYHPVWLEDNEFALSSWYPDFNAVAKTAAAYADAVPDEYVLRSITCYEPDGSSSTLCSADPEDDALVKKIFEEAGERLYSAKELDTLQQQKLLYYGIETVEEEGPAFSPVGGDAALADLMRYGPSPIFVTNTEEFISAIDDGTTLILSPGTYDLTSWLRAHPSVPNLCEDDDAQHGVCTGAWGDEEFTLTNVRGLSVISLDAADPAVLVCEPCYSDVVALNGCSDIYFENLVMGHTPEQGVCTGDVLSLESCDNIALSGCDLYGCGTYGVYAHSSSYRLTDCCIHDCSYGCLSMWDYSSAEIADCSFRSCRGWDMFYMNCSSAVFTGCSFEDLGDPEDRLLDMDDNCMLSFSACTFDPWTKAQIDDYTGEGRIYLDNVLFWDHGGQCELVSEAYRKQGVYLYYVNAPYCYRVPELDASLPGAGALNAELQTDLGTIIDEQLAKIDRKERPDYWDIDWSAYETDSGLLTVVLRLEGFPNGCDYRAYSIDVQSGKRLNNEEIAARAGFSVSELPQAAARAAVRSFDLKYAAYVYDSYGNDFSSLRSFTASCAAEDMELYYDGSRLHALVKSGAFSNGDVRMFDVVLQKACLSDMQKCSSGMDFVHAVLTDDDRVLVSFDQTPEAALCLGGTVPVGTLQVQGCFSRYAALHVGYIESGGEHTRGYYVFLLTQQGMVEYVPIRADASEGLFCGGPLTAVCIDRVRGFENGTASPGKDGRYATVYALTASGSEKVDLAISLEIQRSAAN